METLGPAVQSKPSCPRVQVLSDLHLEVGQQYSTYTFPQSAPFLLLAGDVGRLLDADGYLKVLAAHTSRYQKVFLVLGNHEFYGLDYGTGLKKARELTGQRCLDSKLVLLDKNSWDDPVELIWWQGWRNHAKKRRVLVATHHAPCIDGTSRPKHASNPWTSAFASDLIDRGKWDGLNVWVFGHTHFSADFLRKEIRLVANQRGYVVPGSEAKVGDETRMQTFDPTKAITL